MDYRSDESGYTFTSMLLSLTIIFISIPILLFSMNHLRFIPTNDSLSAQQLFFILQNETYTAQHIYTINDRLYIVLNENETAQFSHYEDIIRRQINGRGHEVYLHRVKSLQMEQLPYGVHIKIGMAD